ncbi:MAG: hypothetical protein AAFV53_38725 [Myxococcota bacterium]
MTLNALAPALVPSILVQLFLGMLSMIAIFAVGVQLARGHRLSPAVIAGAVSLSALAPALIAAASLIGWDPGASAVDLATQAFIASGSRLMAVFILWPLGGILLTTLAVFGARRGPRRWAAAAVGGAGALTVAGLALASGVNGTPEFAAVRAVLYGGMGALTAIALCSGDPEEGVGPEAGGAAVIVFAFCVAAGEAAHRSLITLFLIPHIPRMAESTRETFVTEALAASAPPASIAGAMAAVVVALVFVGLALSARKADRTRHLLGTMWLFALPVIGLVGQVGGERLRQLASASFGVE